MQLGLPRIRGEMSWPPHIQKWHLSDGTSPRSALRRRALLALVPLLMQSALFHVEWSASQLARRLAPVHAGAGGRGQGSRELRRETSRTRQEFDSGHKISVISDQKQNDARGTGRTPVKGARSQKTVEEAANVLRARQTDNPSNICHVCGREDWFGRSQEICGVRKGEKKRPKKRNM